MHAEGLGSWLGGRSRTSQSLVLDDSLSMGYRRTAAVGLRRAQELAAEVVGSRRPARSLHAGAGLAAADAAAARSGTARPRRESRQLIHGAGRVGCVHLLEVDVSTPSTS